MDGGPLPGEGQDVQVWIPEGTYAHLVYLCQWMLKTTHVVHYYGWYCLQL